jgi:hypothetical protein
MKERSPLVYSVSIPVRLGGLKIVKSAFFSLWLVPKAVRSLIESVAQPSAAITTRSFCVLAQSL